MKNILVYILFLYCLCIKAQSIPLIENTNLVATNINNAIYNSATEKFYVLFPSSNTENGNSIGIINAQTYSLENSIFIGNEPSVMAASDDGQYIYIGFKELPSIKRFNISMQSIDMDFNLGSEDDGSWNSPHHYYARDIKVMPGQPNVIAVVRYFQNNSVPDDAGIGIYANGIKRPIDIKKHEAPDSHIIKFKDNNTLIGYDGTTSSAPLNIYTVSSSGIQLTSTYDNTPGPLWTQGDKMDFVFNNDKSRLYFNNSKIVDITSTPYIMNNSLNEVYGGAIVYDNENDLICISDTDIPYPYSFWKVKIKRFNPYNNQLFDSFYIKDEHTPEKIMTCGHGCYALVTYSTNYGSEQPVTTKKLMVVKDSSLFNNNENIVNIISVYPNPATDYIFINSNNILLKDFKIYNIEGKLINKGTLNNKIDLTGLLNGMYILQITDEQGNSYNKKITKK